MFEAIRALFARRRSEEGEQVADQAEQVAEQEHTQRVQFEAWEQVRGGAKHASDTADDLLRRRRALQEENASYRPRAR